MKILINGIAGQMGQAMINAQNDTFSIVGGIDVKPFNCDIPIFRSPWEADVDFDVAIDFSVPTAAMQMLEFCIEKRKPIVVCTTGLSEEDIGKIRESSNIIPVFWSSNMSLGVNLQVMVCKLIAKILGDGADIEIIEKHHNRKVDAPSGTALMIYNAINETLDNKMTARFGRDSDSGKRQKNEIGLHAVRGGTIVGEHEVMFLMEDESISVSHQALSKRVFATGALRAAQYLLDKETGLYNMNDLVNNS